MDEKTLNSLLQKFYNGETNTREEKMLQYYFSGSKDILNEYETDRLLVDLTESLKAKQNATIDTEGRLAAYIDEHTADPLLKRFRRTLTRYAVAAAIALLVGMTGLLFYLHYGKRPADTYTDPQIAFQETEKTLLYISEKLNTGMEHLSNIDKINSGTKPLKSFETIEENLEMVGLFTFMNQTSDLNK